MARSGCSSSFRRPLPRPESCWAEWYAAEGGRTPARIAASMPGVYALVRDKFRVDELYDALFVRPFEAIARVLWKVVDVLIIDGILNAGAFLVELTGDLLRFIQTGNVRNYALTFFLGVVALMLSSWVRSENDVLNAHLLTILIFLPTAGRRCCFSFRKAPGAPRSGLRLAVSAVELALSIPLWTRFDPSMPGFQFAERAEWIPALGISYSSASTESRSSSSCSRRS